MLRKLSLSVVAVAALAAALAPAGASAASSCTLGARATLPSSDPTVVRDEHRATVTLRGGSVTRLKVALRRGGKVVASGSVPGTVRRGAVAVPLTFKTTSTPKGSYKLTVSGVRCGKQKSTSRTLKLTSPTLPVRAAPVSTLAGDNKGNVRIIVRSVGGQKVRNLRATLLSAGGSTVATATVSGSVSTQAIVDLPLARTLAAGKYTLRLTGSAGSTSSSVSLPLVFASGSSGSDPEDQPTGGVLQQKAVVDWSDGKYSGREAAGFVAPGIGHGELVCTPTAQWIRFYPNDQSREVSMMNWTYKDWQGGQEKALREALHTTGTGPDFREGLNKFSPTEKHSTGEFDGIISDRGVIGSSGGPFAAPTTLHLTWVWDMSDSGHESCHLQATFTTQASGSTKPLARSVQVGWRGDGNAAGRTTSSVAVPGLGTATIRCEPGPSGNRTITFDTPGGATVTTREGSDDASVPQGSGPVTAQLPNNGQLSIAFAGGQTALVSSRWKTNDPDGSQNFCEIAAQVVAE
jgi:hypothetical protein